MKTEASKKVEAATPGSGSDATASSMGRGVSRTTARAFYERSHFFFFASSSLT